MSTEVVWKTIVNDTIPQYIGRYIANHDRSISNVSLKISTSLCKFIWQLKDANIYLSEISVYEMVQGYNGTYICFPQKKILSDDLKYLVDRYTVDIDTSVKSMPRRRNLPQWNYTFSCIPCEWIPIYIYFYIRYI